MNMFLVSIIIPVHNGQSFLNNVLTSCINQTYKNVEIIAVNDNSIDNSLFILEKFVKKDNRIKIINNKKNKGVTATRELGVKNSNGEFLFFVDVDDSLPCNVIEQMVLISQKNNSDIVYGDINQIKNGEVSVIRYGSLEISTGKELFDWIIDNRIGFLWGKLIRKNLFTSISVIPTNLTFCEDLIQMLQISNSANIVSKISSNSYNYIQNELSACNKQITRIEFAYRFYDLCIFIHRLILRNRYTDEEITKLKCLYLYYIRLFLWVHGYWGSDSNGLKKYYKEYLNTNEVLKCFYKKYGRIKYMIIKMTNYMPILFCIIYVPLLKYKYKRIK